MAKYPLDQEYERCGRNNRATSALVGRVIGQISSHEEIHRSRKRYGNLRQFMPLHLPKPDARPDFHAPHPSRTEAG